MPAKVTCDINLDSSNDTYLAGQTVFGEIQVKVNGAITVKSLILHVRGIAKCQWGNAKTKVKGKLILLNSSINLEPNQIELTNDNHKYNFNFVLPPAMPSSIQGGKSPKEYQIKYELVLYFIIPWQFDLKFTKEFKIYHGLNLKEQPDLKVPEIEENENMMASIPRTGYFAGEEIPVKIQLKNPNDNRICKIVCFLCRDVKHKVKKIHLFQPTTRTKAYSEKLCRKEVSFVQGQANYDVVLKIPEEKEMLSTIDKDFKLINIQYTVLVDVQIQKLDFPSSSELHFPIKIGLVPLEYACISEQTKPTIPEKMVDQGLGPQIIPSVVEGI